MKLARTATAIGGGELDLDYLVLPVVDGRSPTDTRVTFGAGRLLTHPIDVELAGIKELSKAAPRPRRVGVKPGGKGAHQGERTGRGHVQLGIRQVV